MVQGGSQGLEEDMCLGLEPEHQPQPPLQRQPGEVAGLLPTA